MVTQQEHFSVDKRINISAIVAALFQAAVIVWGASNLYSRVGELEKVVNQGQVRSVVSQDEMNSVKERVLRLEINLTNINAKLDEIKELIMIKTRK